MMSSSKAVYLAEFNTQWRENLFLTTDENKVPTFEALA